jgi:serine protease
MLISSCTVGKLITLALSLFFLFTQQFKNATTAALGNNGKGVRGIIKDGGICFVIVRVFSDYSGAASLSGILSGVQWAVEQQNATIVSMSLGSSHYSTTEDRFYQDLYSRKGSLVIAASGNDGSFRKVYPASYASVVSVAAVDSSQNRANFSQYNNMVDIAAPGVGILSTVPPGLSGIESLRIENTSQAFELRQMAISVSLPVNGISGIIVSCPDLGKSRCPGTGGHICLIQRYVKKRLAVCGLGLHESQQNLDLFRFLVPAGK